MIRKESSVIYVVQPYCGKSMEFEKRKDAMDYFRIESKSDSAMNVLRIEQNIYTETKEIR